MTSSRNRILNSILSKRDIQSDDGCCMSWMDGKKERAVCVCKLTVTKLYLFLIEIYTKFTSMLYSSSKR